MGGVGKNTQRVITQNNIGQRNKSKFFSKYMGRNGFEIKNIYKTINAT